MLSVVDDEVNAEKKPWPECIDRIIMDGVTTGTYRAESVVLACAIHLQLELTAARPTVRAPMPDQPIKERLRRAVAGRRAEAALNAITEQILRVNA